MEYRVLKCTKRIGFTLGSDILYIEVSNLLSSRAIRSASLNHELWMCAALHCFPFALNLVCTPTHPICLFFINARIEFSVMASELLLSKPFSNNCLTDLTWNTIDVPHKHFVGLKMLKKYSGTYIYIYIYEFYKFSVIYICTLF